jgi:hypothetical protein
VLLQQPSWFAAAVLTVPCLDPLGLLLHKRDSELELGPAAADAQVRPFPSSSVCPSLLTCQRCQLHANKKTHGLQAGLVGTHWCRAIMRAYCWPRLQLRKRD